MAGADRVLGVLRREQAFCRQSAHGRAESSALSFHRRVEDDPEHKRAVELSELKGLDYETIDKEMRF